MCNIAIIRNSFCVDSMRTLTAELRPGQSYCLLSSQLFVSSMVRHVCKRCYASDMTPTVSPVQARPNNNSVVAFKDNSSAIRGFDVKPLLPLNPGGPSALAPQHRDWDLLLTAETHNFPCAVAPYPGVLTRLGWLQLAT